MPGVVLVLGEDRLLTHEAADAVLRKHPRLERVRLNGEEARLAAVLDEARTPTLLGERRAVVVDNAAKLFPEGGLEAIARYAEHPAPESLLLLIAVSLDGRLKAAKSLRASAQVIDCARPPPFRMAEWVMARGHDTHGIELHRAAAEALVARLGAEPAPLDTALARIRTMIAPRTDVTVGDVAGSTGDHRSPILFEPGNALEDRDLDGALDALGAAFSEGLKLRSEGVTDAAAVAAILLGNLHTTWVKLIRFHRRLQGGESEADAARGVGISPRAQRYFLGRARKHRIPDLLERHSAFLRADLALKRSVGEPRQVLERLVLELLA